MCVDQLICQFTGDAAHTKVFQPQVVPHNTKEAGDLPGWQASTFDVLMHLEVI
jgi:hypothetical protein